MNVEFNISPKNLEILLNVAEPSRLVDFRVEGKEYSALLDKFNILKIYQKNNPSSRANDTVYRVLEVVLEHHKPKEEQNG